MSIFTTITDPEQRQDPYLEAIDNYLDFADEVVVIDGSEEFEKGLLVGKNIKWIGSNWSKEFDWDFIGKQFTRGYLSCTGDWVMRMDIDYFLHPDDFEDIIEFLKNCDAPAAMMPKKQFLLADRYRVKSLVPVAYNKGKYGDRIKLDSGGDLCQPSLDGKELNKEMLPIISRKEYIIVGDDVTKKQQRKRLPKEYKREGNVVQYMNRGIHLWNYECLLRTKKVEAREFHRFAKAWKRTFGNDPLGAESEEKALEKFLDMQLGRFKNDGWATIKLKEHPKYIQETIKKLTKEQFGYSLWNHTEPANYFKDLDE